MLLHIMPHSGVTEHHTYSGEPSVSDVKIVAQDKDEHRNEGGHRALTLEIKEAGGSETEAYEHDQTEHEQTSGGVERNLRLLERARIHHKYGGRH